MPYAPRGGLREKDVHLASASGVAAPHHVRGDDERPLEVHRRPVDYVLAAVQPKSNAVHTLYSPSSLAMSFSICSRAAMTYSSVVGPTTRVSNPWGPNPGTMRSRTRYSGSLK